MFLEIAMSLPTLEWQFLSRKGGPYVSQPGAVLEGLGTFILL